MRSNTISRPDGTETTEKRVMVRFDFLEQGESSKGAKPAKNSKADLRAFAPLREPPQIVTSPKNTTL